MGDEESFEDGLDDLMVDAGVEEPTEPTQQDEPREVDYSEMSKKEIQSLIDDALDAGDFDTVGKLHKYL